MDYEYHCLKVLKCENGKTVSEVKISLVVFSPWLRGLIFIVSCCLIIFLICVFI